MALISDGAFVEDRWRHLAEEEALPKTGAILVSLPRLQEALAQSGLEIGVIAPNTTELAALEPALPRLALIAVAFPAFSDGRGFSLARLLRRAGFTGELRASGRLVADQYGHALACGFDTIEIAQDIAARQGEGQWRAAFAAHKNAYQQGYGGRGSILDERRKATQ
jgi:uncharacterized protein (DUF934 family)